MENSSPFHIRHNGRFFDNSMIFRIVILLLLAFSLFLFIHYRESKVPLLELGSVATRYVVADVPFSFVDEEMTAAARQAIVQDLGKIYEIASEDVLKRKSEFENLLINDQWWRVMSPQASFDEMCRANERLSNFLLEVRFSDIRTIDQMRQSGFDVSFMFDIVPIDMSQGICFTDRMWEFIRKRAFSDMSFEPATVDFLISSLHDKIWMLRLDTALAKRVRKQIRQMIPQRYTSTPAGTRIIDSGEKISTRHLAMLQAMRQAMDEQRNLWHPRTVLGSLILTFVFMTVMWLFIRSYYPVLLQSNSTLALIFTIVLLGLASAKLLELFLLKTTHGVAELIHYPLLTPFVGILLCILVNPGIALFFVAVLSVLFKGFLSFEFHGFLLQNLLVGFVVVFYTRTLRRRAEIVTIGIRGWVTASAVICALYLYDHSKYGTTLFADIGSAGIFMLLTSIVVVGLLPIFEAVFHILTDINLMEYMNPNHELLQRLMIEAPGTYQHSLLVGNISEAAARAIGANGLFCRVATLYHDVGKIPTAQYYTENQQSGMNIHQLLTPVESARVIISHVQEGVNLARRAGLPEEFIDVIREHHGTSLVYYFYHKQLEAVGHDPTKVDDREFRYAGPKPKCKESAILMIADSFEAACRSIDEANEETLTSLIDQIVREKIDDGQFDECQISFEELHKVKKTMVRSLLSIGHFRIKYPSKVRLH